jgi:aspartyl-tRNA synthetase
MKKIFNIEVNNFLDKEVELFGFVSSIRDHGKLFFFDLKDRSGIVQCVISNDNKFFLFI